MLGASHSKDAANRKSKIRPLSSSGRAATRHLPSSCGCLSVAGCFLLSACSTTVPNTTLAPTTEFGRQIDSLWDILLIAGIVVFVIVEVALLYVLFRFRARENDPRPKQVHGNTVLEITWTLIPALVLVFIAVPTVRTIFSTQAPPGATALQVEVIGHQWWWEFRYPQYGITTANELYLPVGRTVNFALSTADVLHSFWIPQLGGKRDLISNDTNYISFAAESAYVWNGFCAEFCGASHANMRFRAFTMPTAEFDRWVLHQKSPPVIGGSVAFTVPALPRHTIPTTSLPSDVSVGATAGDATRGAAVYKTSACIGCHNIAGVSPGVIGPNLTHIGSRTTIGAALYPNDFQHMARWIKNAPALKPGSLMPPMGKGLERTMGNLDDQQIADIAAYLLSLK
ncbi:MAG: cytochrome c oxidase subunit II [Gemmatimonadaceae bacterium]